MGTAAYATTQTVPLCGMLLYALTGLRPPKVRHFQEQSAAHFKQGRVQDEVISIPLYLLVNRPVPKKHSRSRNVREGCKKIGRKSVSEIVVFTNSSKEQVLIDLVCQFQPRDRVIVYFGIVGITV